MGFLGRHRIFRDDFAREEFHPSFFGFFFDDGFEAEDLSLVVGFLGEPLRGFKFQWDGGFLVRFNQDAPVNAICLWHNIWGGFLSLL